MFILFHKYLGEFMKRIAIFIDGTRNLPDAEHPTNVVRLAQSIKHKAKDRMPQIVLYSTGGRIGAGQHLGRAQV